MNKTDFLGNLLTSDGKNLYMGRHQFDLKDGKHQKAKGKDFIHGLGGRNTAATFDEAEWVYGASCWQKGNIVGQMLAVGPERTYGLTAWAPWTGKGSAPNAPKWNNFSLFAQVPAAKSRVWREPISLRVRAMVLAGKSLFVAGPNHPDIPELTPLNNKRKEAAFYAKLPDEKLHPKEGRLVALSAADGKQLKEWKIDAPPVFDGMAVAGGRLFLATQDGKLRCFGN